MSASAGPSGARKSAPSLPSLAIACLPGYCDASASASASDDDEAAAGSSRSRSSPFTWQATAHLPQRPAGTPLAALPAGRLELADGGGSLRCTVPLRPGKFELELCEDGGDDVLLVRVRDAADAFPKPDPDAAKGGGDGDDDDKKMEMVRQVILSGRWRELQRMAEFLEACGERLDGSDDESDIGVYGGHHSAPGTALLRSWTGTISRGADATTTAGTTSSTGTGDSKEQAVAVLRALRAEQRGGGEGKEADSSSSSSSSSSDCGVQAFSQPAAPAGGFVGAESRAALMAMLDAEAAKDSAAFDTKLVLTRAELEAVIGKGAVVRMQLAFGARIDQVKLRRVQADAEHSLINFHLDHARKTMGVALNDPTDYDGSRIVYAHPVTGFTEAHRAAGTATVHDNTIPHGVTPLTRGTRYGLFLLNHGE